MTRWLDPPSVPVPEEFEILGLHPLAAQALVRRGITDLASARAFLDPQALPPTPVPGAREAAQLIRAAIQRGDKICVWGDFDVDGQTSTTLLVQTLQILGADPMHYIPVRARETHGVHVTSLEPIIQHGAKLLLTCDTGITAHEAVEHARAAGLTVIITDHHLPGPTLPNAHAILNPKLLSEEHALQNLAGVGVAYKLAEALLQQHPARLEALLDLVALGLIADVALLLGETRSLAQRGLEALRRTARLGIRIIAQNTQTSLETLTEETIGFTFGPRLNALGRLDDANPAVEFLLSKDPERVRVIAAQLENLNAQRRLLTSQVYQAAEAQLRQDPDLLAQPILILSHENWPGGVVGIAASRLVERYNKPAILLTKSAEGILSGSARSVEDLHITEAIASQEKLLRGFGGHPMAAGLSMPAENLARFRHGLAREVERQLGASAREEPSLEIDAWLGLDSMTLELAESLEKLAPFGAGNPGLIFAVRNVTLKAVTEVGRTREHLRLTVEDSAGLSQGVVWWGAVEEDLPEPGSRIDLAFSLRASTYRGQRQLAAEFIDLRLVQEAPALEALAPQIEIIDLRHAARPAAELQKIKNEHPGLEVWAEGPDRALGMHRHELDPAKELAIYSIPPSAVDLRIALKRVSPERVYLFSVLSADDKRNGFLERLAGLCKFTLNQRGGQARLVQLAAATSQREGAVLHGLGWLQAKGMIAFEGEEEIMLTAGNKALNTELANAFEASLDWLLHETSNYRRYYSTAADPAVLLKS